MKNRQWYRFEASAADPSVVDLHIVDFIGDWIDDYWGFGVTAKAFIDQLSKLPEAVKTIRVHVNSPGGDVWSAVNIANALRAQRATNRRTVEAIIDGLAASAASIIIMAGDPIRIADNGLVMIHRPVSGIYGTSEDMRQYADAIDKVRDQIVATYRWHSELSVEELVALMDATTWMTADEAIANGFATEKVEGLQAAATLSAGALAKLSVPEKYRDRVAALVKPEPTPPAPPVVAKATEVLTLVESAGLSTAFARELIEAALPLEGVKAKLARAKEIKALCVTATLEGLADGYIRGSMAAADVKAHLTTITARMDKAEIDANLPPGHERGVAAPTVINSREIYERFNAPHTAQRNGG
jgi:ATP-dependent protease ClpP protease subunit